MTKEELQAQINDGVIFSCYIDRNKIVGVMGIQHKTDVNLIRHAYVMTTERKKGIGTILIKELLTGSDKPILIGTWKAAYWAISFYERHGFFVVSEEEKNRLLRKYWCIPDRQVETSIVLADAKYKDTESFKQSL
jgi:N-acetylglutamate synthase-like GNAT family acetyltransferase